MFLFVQKNYLKQRLSLVFGEELDEVMIMKKNEMKGTAIIIVDMQNEFCVEPSGESVKLKDSIEKLVTPINNSISYIKKMGGLAIWLNWGIRNSDLPEMNEHQLRSFNNFEYPDSMLFKKSRNKDLKVLEINSWSASIISSLNYNSSDLNIHKTRMSGFWNCNLDEALKKKGIRQLYFAGVNTDQCVMVTLQDAYFAGYEVSLLKDCTSTSSPEHCFDSTIYNIEKCFGEVLESFDLKQKKASTIK